MPPPPPSKRVPTRTRRTSQKYTGAVSRFRMSELYIGAAVMFTKSVNKKRKVLGEKSK